MENFDDTNISQIEAKFPKGNPFDLPSGYFLSLPGKIAGRITYDEAIKEMPDGYFKSQEEGIMQRINFEETFSKKLPYETPVGYFETLTAAIESKTTASSKVKKLSFEKFRWAYAAAASVLLCFGLFYNQTTPVQFTHTNEQISADSLSTAAIVGTLNNSDISDEEIMQQIDALEFSSQMKIDENDETKILDEIDESDLTQDM